MDVTLKKLSGSTLGIPLPDFLRFLFGEMHLRDETSLHFFYETSLSFVSPKLES